MQNSPPTLPSVVLTRNERIEICIPSRGRTLNLVCLLQALRTQTFADWDLTILDDNPDDSIKSNFTLQAMTSLLEMEGHRCRIIKGEAAGLPRAQNALLAATTKNLIARIDDDTLPSRTDYLAMLMNVMLRDSTGIVGAVGGPIPHFQGGDLTDYALPSAEALDKYAPFEAPFIRYVQPQDAAPRTVTALYSTFIYKRAYLWASGGFSLSYSTVAEKEETDVLTRTQFMGAKLVFHPHALLWHIKAPSGGIRYVSEEEKDRRFQQDYANFVARMKRLKDGTFNWKEEAEANLRPFEKYTAIQDTDRGYIEV
jgi:hypothetical protein